MPNEPCVLLVLPDLDERRVLMAELIERGLDPIGFQAPGWLWLDPPPHARCPEPAVVLIDQHGLGGRRRVLVDLARSRWPSARFVLLAGATQPLAPGRWAAVLRRPISIDELATAVEHLASEADGGGERPDFRTGSGRPPDGRPGGRPLHQASH